jgi:plasmid maintenance system antidote protein VapI
MTYIEFQNKVNSNPPIAIRASNYCGLSVQRFKDFNRNSQIWLLAENDDTVLCGQYISNFRTVEDNTGVFYPREVNIMFVSLPRFSEEDSIYGDLSRLLLGVNDQYINDSLKPIKEMFQSEFISFKEKEEVMRTMTALEEKYLEGHWEGRQERREEGREEGIIDVLRTMLGENYSIAAINKLAGKFGVSDERLNELINKAEAV